LRNRPRFFPPPLVDPPHSAGMRMDCGVSRRISCACPLSTYFPNYKLFLSIKVRRVLAQGLLCSFPSFAIAFAVIDLKELYFRFFPRLFLPPPSAPRSRLPLSNPNFAFFFISRRFVHDLDCGCFSAFVFDSRGSPPSSPKTMYLVIRVHFLMLPV